MPSLRYFTILNSALFSLGALTHTLYIQCPYSIPAWLYILDIVFIFLLQHITLRHKNSIIPTKNILKILPISCTNSISLLTSLYFFSSPPLLHNIVYEIAMFIPYSFIFELVFDFFHYWTHRASHKIPCLYRRFHSIHHRHVHISIYTTFEHHIADLLFTNMFPILLTAYLLHPTAFFLCVWIMYKVLEEMYGHIGVATHASSFPQCIWLPRWLGIELYSMDHAHHHRNPHVNFSKRFVVWDRVFGTYQPPPPPRVIHNE